MFNILHYISQGVTVKEQLQNIHQALDNGCDWVQLRFKYTSAMELFTLAEAVKFLCEEYLATFIINDNVHLAQQLVSDGVHLGLTDMSIAEARQLLGNKIIGGTANTFEDVLQRANENCDYIGLGPFQYSATKSNLSPILGIEGYSSILKKMEERNITVPVYAIGGITIGDVDDLMKTGIHGIAVSGLITNHIQQKQLITQLHEKLYVNI